MAPCRRHARARRYPRWPSSLAAQHFAFAPRRRRRYGTLTAMPAAITDGRLSLPDALALVEAVQRAARTGLPLDLAPGVPDDDLDPGQGTTWPAARHIPANLIRAILLDPRLIPDAQGLTLRGAAILGVLDLRGANLPCRLRLRYCHFGSRPDMADLRTPELGLVGCHLPGLCIDNARIDGGAFLARITSTGLIQGYRAQINGQLSLVNAHLSSAGKVALNLDRAHIGGSVFLRRVVATGKIRFVGAQIAGQLSLSNARLVVEDGESLSLDRAHIGASVYLKSLISTGEIRAYGTSVSGKLDLSDAYLDSHGENVFSAGGATIEQLYLSDSTNIKKVLNLGRARINTVITETRLPTGSLDSSGWRIEDVHGVLRTDQVAVRRWLDSTPQTSGDSSRRTSIFVAQPWHELANLYDRTGQADDARSLRVHAAWRTTRYAPLWRKGRLSIYGVVVGFGHMPLLAGIWLIAAIATASLLISIERGSFVPSNPTLLQAALAATSAVDGSSGLPISSPANMLQTSSITGASSCQQLHNIYPCLDPLIYGSEVVLPTTVGIGQNTAWRSNKEWITRTLFTLRILGWIFTALLLAGLTGLLRKT